MGPPHRLSRNKLEDYSVDLEKAHSSQPVDSLAAWGRIRNRTNKISSKPVVYLGAWGRIRKLPSLNSKPVDFLGALVRAPRINSSHNKQEGYLEETSRLSQGRALGSLVVWASKLSNKVVLHKVNSKQVVYSITRCLSNQD